MLHGPQGRFLHHVLRVVLGAHKVPRESVRVIEMDEHHALERGIRSTWIRLHMERAHSLLTARGGEIFPRE